MDGINICTLFLGLYHNFCYMKRQRGMFRPLHAFVSKGQSKYNCPIDENFKLASDIFFFIHDIFHLNAVTLNVFEVGWQFNAIMCHRSTFFVPSHNLCSIWNIFHSCFYAKTNNKSNKASFRTFEHSSRLKMFFSL